MQTIMRNFGATLGVVGIVLLSACTSTDSTLNGADQGAYNTRGVSDTFGYNPDGSINGGAGNNGNTAGLTGSNGFASNNGIVGGPSASQASRIVYFDFNSAQVRQDSRAIVEAHARYLMQHPGNVAYLEGHADERGTREYNVALGERRNNTVRQLMSVFGVNPQQIRTISYGEERPLVLGSDEASYAQNRRVEIAY